MITRKSLFVVAAMILFVVGLSACAPGEAVMAPDVEISMDAAVAGQGSVMSALSGGEVSLSDAEASSLITELMKQNGLDALEIASIDASMADGMNNISLQLGKPIAGIDSLGVGGMLMSDGGVVSVDISSAHAGNMGVAPEMLDFVSSQINAQLAGMPLGLPDGSYALTPEMAGQLMGMMEQMGLNSAAIDAVKTGFDGGQVHLVAELADAVMGVDSLGLAGAVSMDGGHLSLDLANASAGGLAADPGMLGMISDQINAALGGVMLPAMNINADGGNLMVGMGQ